jgi:hypothetical protein
MILTSVQRMFLSIGYGALCGLLTGVFINGLIHLLDLGSTFLQFAALPDPPGAGSGVGGGIGLLVGIRHVRPWVGAVIGTLVGVPLLGGILWGAPIPPGRLLIYALLLLSHALMGWSAAWGSTHRQRRGANP